MNGFRHCGGSGGLVAKLCPTLVTPMDCSLPGSFVHGILQARILEWVAISFSRGSSQPRNQTQISHTAGRFFTDWATREDHCGTYIYIFNGILLSYKKECIRVSPNEVDEPTEYCTKWSKWERERQILYINACLWNLERWYWWTYLLGSSGDANTENRLVDTMAEGESGTNWENSMERYTLPYVK